MEIKNKAANISLNGVVITLATDALLASAIRTPAKNAPVAHRQSDGFGSEMIKES
ncbi:hypothetical protein [Candidatus Nitrosocosmicus sp. FF01]|uniref:hypothetical protein n=1 Tax=Candidatus Nitrosocosmicus sp. FF01 TaxID=3397670 RepID=UPI0039E9A5BB